MKPVRPDNLHRVAATRQSEQGGDRRDRNGQSASGYPSHRDSRRRLPLLPDGRCPTVYFAADGESRFTEDSLSERVHQKHPEDDDVFVCYCFRHTPGSIRAEPREMGETGVIESVTAGIRAGKCACDIRNPQGSCCLGNVRAVVDRSLRQ